MLGDLRTARAGGGGHQPKCPGRSLALPREGANPPEGVWGVQWMKTPPITHGIADRAACVTRKVVIPVTRSALGSATLGEGSRSKSSQTVCPAAAPGPRPSRRSSGTGVRLRRRGPRSPCVPPRCLAGSSREHHCVGAVQMTGELIVTSRTG